jgi:2-polyprenyl-3-methyl-5-hydroxy-6-metoxy-1,4-benzoquinol methylase
MDNGNNFKKTIFLVISQSLPARNILQTEVFKLLKERDDLRIVIFLPENPPEYYIKELSGPNVIFEKIPPICYPVFRRKIFDPLLTNCLVSKTIATRILYGRRKEPPKPKMIMLWLFWSNIFGRIVWVKRLLRALEMKLYPEAQTGCFFEKYNPDLVFITSIHSKVEIPFLKEARRRKVRNLLFSKSWDTYDMSLYRILPDEMAVQNEEFKKLTVNVQDIKESNITAVGFPQFDVYFNFDKKAPSRDSFLAGLGLDPGKKIIFFGSGGMWGPYDELIAEDLHNFIKNKKDYSLIVRTHFADPKPERFDRFKNLPNVYFDNRHRKNEMYHELGDQSKEDMDHLANLLFFSDIVVGTVSTLSLDAACFDKPVICTASSRVKGGRESHFHETGYYQTLLNTGGVKLVFTGEELLEAVENYLKNPALDCKEREILRNRLCYKVDGNSCKRLAELVLNRTYGQASTKQQSEALKYFKERAEDWQRKAVAGAEGEINVVKQRNDYAVRIADERGGTESVLDIGCGTGDLICQLAQKGISATGIDFSEEMINIARGNVEKLGLEKAKFECSSIFDSRIEPEKYDMVSANGFIEYISYEELDNLLEISFKALKPGGSLVFGSRNRLFNIFSLNEFTEEEINENNIGALMQEAIKIKKCDNVKDLVGFKTAPLQKADKEYPQTRINVSTRYQFTPAQLINMLAGKGFLPVEVFPIHIHGVPPEFKNNYPLVHGNISNLLHSYSRGSMRLVPQSASFMIHARKIGK